jgi:hypothetical protein
MNRTRILALVFLAVAAVQVALPAMRIRQYEQTLQGGTAYKFRTRPVDPYDAFRGRYVTLGYDMIYAPWGEKEKPPYGEKVYVLVERGPDGFAQLSKASRKPPTGENWLALKSTDSGGEGLIGVELPFDRFYMTELLAPIAEDAFRRRARAQLDSFALVRVKNGFGVIEQVYLGDKTIAEVARE